MNLLPSLVIVTRARAREGDPVLEGCNPARLSVPGGGLGLVNPNPPPGQTPAFLETTTKKKKSQFVVAASFPNNNPLLYNLPTENSISKVQPKKTKQLFVYFIALLVLKEIPHQWKDDGIIDANQ